MYTVQCQVNIYCQAPQPSNALYSPRIDFFHQSYLTSFLGIVPLVDTDRINPKVAKGTMREKKWEGNGNILGDIQL